MTFTDPEIDYLTGQPIGRLATKQPNGNLQVNPVGFAYNSDTGTIDIGGYTMSVSRKYRNVADNGRVAFVLDDVVSTDPWRVRFHRHPGSGTTPGAGPQPSRPSDLTTGCPTGQPVRGHAQGHVPHPVNCAPRHTEPVVLLRPSYHCAKSDRGNPLNTLEIEFSR
ncbi:MAG: pyridoxamine 5-phosphate oxidase family protein [Pseudonocardiales bacterium]|nr:pyridoxamine 5-phosphate oxidase family protein [Pseudonocardiales bacterium]